MKVKYPIHEIRNHLNQIEGRNELGYDRVRVLWFIANTFDEVYGKQKQSADLRDIAFVKPK